MTAREEKRLRDKIRNALLTDEGMVRFLDDLFGRNNYSYDPTADLWIAPDADYVGDGRGMLVIERGGNWFRAVIPAGVLQ